MEESTVRRLGGSRLTATVALTGAVLQVVYGLLACVWTYPRITGRPFEAVWGLATLGMIANVLTWLAIGVARPRRLAVTGGVLAIAGFAARFVISVVIVADPRIDTGTASVAVAIPVTIVLMFSGLALLGIATRRARRHGRVGAAAGPGGRPGRRALLLLRPARALHPAWPAVGQRLAAHGTDRLPAWHRRCGRQRGRTVGGGLNALSRHGDPVHLVRRVLRRRRPGPAEPADLGRFGHRGHGHGVGRPGGVVRLHLADHAVDRGRAGRGRAARPCPRHRPGTDGPVAVPGRQRARPRFHDLRPGRDQHPSSAPLACPAGTSASSTGPTASARPTSPYWHRPRWAVSPRRSCAPACCPDGPDTSFWPRRSCCWASTPRSAARCRSRSSSHSSPSASRRWSHKERKPH